MLMLNLSGGSGLGLGPCDLGRVRSFRASSGHSAYLSELVVKYTGAGL